MAHPNAADEDRRFTATLILINMLIGNSKTNNGRCASYFLPWPLFCAVEQRETSGNKAFVLADF